MDRETEFAGTYPTIGDIWKEDGCNALLRKTPVSTLCAVCDKIKELHPSTHEWTAKETPASSMDHGGVGQVGCENADGTLNIHSEAQTCEVCSAKETKGK